MITSLSLPLLSPIGQIAEVEQDLKDYNNAFNCHRHEILSRPKDLGYDVSPGSKLGGTTTSARNQTRLSEGSESRQRSKSVGPSTSSRPNAALLARASFNFNVKDAKNAVNSVAMASRLTTKDTNQATAGSSATRPRRPTTETGADDEYDEYLS